MKQKSAQITSIAGPWRSSIGNAPPRRLPLSDWFLRIDACAGLFEWTEVRLGQGQQAVANAPLRLRLRLQKRGDGPLTALYVLCAVGLGTADRRRKRPTPTRRYEEAVLKDIVDLADRSEQPCASTSRPRMQSYGRCCRFAKEQRLARLDDPLHDDEVIVPKTQFLRIPNTQFFSCPPN